LEKRFFALDFVFILGISNILIVDRLSFRSPRHAHHPATCNDAG
jgi:hypothetical protein